MLKFNNNRRSYMNPSFPHINATSILTALLSILFLITCTSTEDLSLPNSNEDTPQN
jgi:hypothetical protein